MTNVYLPLSDGQHKRELAYIRHRWKHGIRGVGGRGRKGIREFKERRRDRDNDTDERKVRMIRCRGMREWTCDEMRSGHERMQEVYTVEVCVNRSVMALVAC